MTNEELLEELAAKIGTGAMRREDVMNRLQLAPAVAPTEAVTPKPRSHFSITKTLYVLGAAIVVIGLVIFVAQIWDDIGAFGHIVVTLGLGLLMTALGAVLLQQKPETNLGPVFHTIGGILIPGGAVVTLYELEIDFASLWSVAVTFGIIFAFYLLLNAVQKHAILTFFAIANGTAFVYLLVEAIVDGPYYRHGDLYAYLTMVVGASYLLLAYAFRDGWNKELIEVLYFFGITGILGAAFSQVFDSLPWQLV